LAYIKTVWSTGDVVTATLANNWEKQYDEAIKDTVNVSGDTMTGTLILPAIYSDDITTGNKQVVNPTTDTIYLGNPATKMALEASANPTITVGSTVHLLWHAGNDGAGSGLDADLLDGLQGYAFLQRAGGLMTGDLKLQNDGKIAANDSLSSAGQGGIIQMTNQANALAGYGIWNTYNTWFDGTSWVQPRGSLHSYAQTVNYHNQFAWYYAPAGSVNGGAITLTQVAKMDHNGQLFKGSDKYWNSGNDGSGSGLDADLLDGKHAADFVAKSSRAYGKVKCTQSTTTILSGIVNHGLGVTPSAIMLTFVNETGGVSPLYVNKVYTENIGSASFNVKVDDPSGRFVSTDYAMVFWEAIV
jgi:hypothetical protein